MKIEFIWQPGGDSDAYAEAEKILPKGADAQARRFCAWLLDNIEDCHSIFSDHRRAKQLECPATRSNLLVEIAVAISQDMPISFVLGPHQGPCVFFGAVDTLEGRAQLVQQLYARDPTHAPRIAGALPDSDSFIHCFEMQRHNQSGKLREIEAMLLDLCA